MLLQIHDELLLEAPEEEIPVLHTLVQEEMEHAFELRVPLKVDVSSGPNWSDLKSLEE
jgi:DNA polymerase-1